MTERTPQVEDGYTRLANALIEALARARLNGQELSVALAVVRMTYGYQKRADRIAASQIAKLTGIPSKKIGPLLRRLEEKHILAVERRGRGRTPTIAIDKRTSRWPLRDSTYPQEGGGEHTPSRGEVSAQPTPNRGEEPTPNRGESKDRKKSRDGYGAARRPRQGKESSAIGGTPIGLDSSRPPETEPLFGDVTPMMPASELDQMIGRFPGGVTYTREEVRAWVIWKWPDVLEWRHPKTGKAYVNPKQALKNWWKRANREEVDAAVRAAVARRAAAKLAEPVPEIDEAEFDEFVRAMRKVGF